MNILITMPVKDTHRVQIERAAANNPVEYIHIDCLTAENVKNKDIILGNIPIEFIKSANKLKLLQLNMSGYEGYPDAMPQGAYLTNTRGAFGLAISEHMLGMLLMLIKRLHQYRDNQLQSLWRDEGNVTSIEGSTVLTIGLGNIGGDFARKIKMLGGYTIAVKRDISNKPDYIDELYTLDKIDELLPRADAVALCVPSSTETFKLMDSRRLSLMKQGSVLLNVGRGNAIDTEALYEAVSFGHIMAGLDVTDPEPLPKEHPLWREPNVLITPHISGFYHLPQTFDRIVGIACDNLKSFLNNNPLKNVVHPT